jgi:carbon starvation protein
LYWGVQDPLGGVNSLWPLFGISNQLLAAVALCVGTTIIINEGKARYAAITLVPLAWLVTVTTTAGLEKIFSADPKLGFLAHANTFSAMLATGTLPPGVKDMSTGAKLVWNDRLDAAITAFFLASVMVILIASISRWMTALRTPRRNDTPQVARG